MEAPSVRLAQAVSKHCETIGRSFEKTTFAFEASTTKVAQLITSVFNLSLETHETRPIRGSFLLVDDLDRFIEQVPTWQFAKLDLAVSDLEYKTIKTIVASMHEDIAIVLSCQKSGFYLHGLLRQRFKPTLMEQRGIHFEGIYEWLPLSVEIQYPGRVIVGIGKLIIGARRGDEVYLPQLPSSFPLWTAVLGYAGGWDDPHAAARLLRSAVHEIAMRRTGGTIVVGPRIDLDNQEILQPGSRAINGISIPNTAVSCFKDWLSSDAMLQQFKREPLKMYCRYEKQKKSHEELVDMIACLASADGAILIDEDGNLYAYHVYFPAKGAEHKSSEGGRHAAVHEFMIQSQSWFSNIISQDGTITLLARDWGKNQMMKVQ